MALVIYVSADIVLTSDNIWVQNEQYLFQRSVRSDNALALGNEIRTSRIIKVEEWLPYPISKPPEDYLRAIAI